MSTFNAGVGHTVSKTQKQQKSTTYVNDRLFILKDVVPDTHGANTGYLVCLNEKGDTIRVKIAQVDFDRNQASLAKRKDVPDDVKFMGHLIDEKMKKALLPTVKAGAKAPVKKVIIEGCYYKTSIKVDGEKINVYEGKRVINIVNASAQKLISAPVTVFGFYDSEKERYNVANAQAWHKKAIGINDEKGLNELKEQIDAVSNQEDYKLVPIGIQFRTIIKNKKFNSSSQEDSDVKKEKPYIVISVSTPFDYIPKTEDVDGHNIDGDFLINMAKSYDEWTKSEDAGILIELDGQKITADDLINEVTYYHNYRCSNKSKSMFLNVKQTGAPLYQMMLTKTGTSIADSDDALMGKNWGGNCFLLVSPNKRVDVLDDDGEPTGETEIVYQHFVGQIYSGGYRGNIQSFINAHFDTPVESEDFITNGCSVASGLFRIANDKDVNVSNKATDDDIEAHNNQDEEFSTETEEIDSSEIKAKQVDLIDDDIPF